MTSRHWTPYEIEIVLHHYASGARFPRWTAPGYEPAVLDLARREVLTVKGDDIVLTDIGRALVEMWLQTPRPELKMVDPRTGKEVEPERTVRINAPADRKLAAWLKHGSGDNPSPLDIGGTTSPDNVQV